jgi:acylphosphatase
MKIPSANLPSETVYVVIKGVVQGVGYRHATVRRAHMLGVTGWVQNIEDGTVHALVQGLPDQVDAMLEWLRRGPPGAAVQDLTVHRPFTDRRFDHFEQK